MDDIAVSYVDSLSEALRFKTWLGERRPVLAIDTETGGLEWWRVRLRLAQFGDGRTSWVVPFADWAGLVKEAMHDYTGQIVMHNAKFDRHMLSWNGCESKPWHQIDDTSIMAHVLDSTRPVALKGLAKSLQIDPAADASQLALDMAMQKQGWTWDTIPDNFPTYIVYAAMDAVWTARLWEVFQPQLIERNLWSVYQLDLCVNELIERMEMNGARIDVTYCESNYAMLMKWVAEATTWVKQTYHIAPTSNKKLADALEQLGFLLTKYTPSGEISVDGDVLRAIDHPLAQISLRVRQLSKIAKTYLLNFMELHDTGYIRPSTKVLGAKTGRMSMSQPNLQNLPRDHAGRPEALVVRNCFIPRDDNVLVLADFDQIEQRIMAHYAWQVGGDPGMVHAFAQGGDFFTNMAHRIYSDLSIEKRDLRRQMTKNGAYAKGYGAGPEKFGITVGIPFDAAIAFLDRYDEMFPGVRAFQKETEREALTRDTPYAVAASGRIHKAERGKLYTLVNYKIQGEACDVLKWKMLQLDQAGLGEYMILPVHDEVILDVPREHVKDVVRVVEQVMPEQSMYSVPLTVGVDVVDRWGKKFIGETIAIDRA